MMASTKKAFSTSSKFVLGLTLLLIFCISHANAQSQSKPKSIDSLVQFTNANYNMGKIAFGKPVQYDVSVKNISSDTISIAIITAGCGCTTPKYTKGQVIQPGQSANITLGFNGSSTGAFTKYATIFFGNGLSKQLQFSGEAIKE